MPIYEYECDKCNHGFEREQSISDPPVKTCPKCRSRKVTKLISRSSFVLKGGGWYADGYSDAKNGSSSDSSSSSDGKSDSGTESSDASTKTESKTSDKGKSDKGKSGGPKGKKKNAA
jgi:putative FmdB family regulatory protein